MRERDREGKDQVTDGDGEDREAEEWKKIEDKEKVKERSEKKGFTRRQRSGEEREKRPKI